jgi:hypothetical protein
MRINRRAAKELLGDLELERGVFGDDLQHADGRGGDFGADTVAWEDGDFVSDK